MFVQHVCMQPQCALPIAVALFPISVGPGVTTKVLLRISFNIKYLCLLLWCGLYPSALIFFLLEQLIIRSCAKLVWDVYHSPSFETAVLLNASVRYTL